MVDGQSFELSRSMLRTLKLSANVASTLLSVVHLTILLFRHTVLRQGSLTILATLVFCVA